MRLNAQAACGDDDASPSNTGLCSDFYVFKWLLTRNEPRDLYDLWHLTSNEGVELETVVDAIRQKLEFRGKPFTGIAAAIRSKEPRLRALWSGRLAYQMAALPQFDEVFRAVQRTLRHAKLP